MSEFIHKSVNDLGVAAYLLMYGFQPIGKRAKLIFFECDNADAAKEFDRLVLEYQPPNEFYTFDSCLMFLKKMNDQEPLSFDNNIHKTISDLGIAAYLLMQEYSPKSIGLKVIGKKGRNVYFEHPEDKGEDFERISYQYLPSQFQKYDSNLMALKKMNDYSLRK